MKTPLRQCIHGILFDYGGTLDTNGRHWAYVLRDGYRNAGVTVPEALFREAYVFGERALAREPVIKPEDNFLTLLQKKVHLEFDFLVQCEAICPTVSQREKAEAWVAGYCYEQVQRVLFLSRRVLQDLSAVYPLVMVTNFYGNMQSVLRDFHLDVFFQTVVESAVVGVRKPDPGIFRLGVEALRLPPEEVCVVGDSFEKDILPALSLGCHAVWFKGEEWKPVPHDESLPDAVITDITSLTRTLLY